MPMRRLIAAALSGLLLAAGWPVVAQESGAFGPPVRVIEIEPMEIVSDPATYRENVRRTTRRLREADAALRVYLRASMQAIMQGHTRGFAAFESWYRRRDARLRAEAAERETIARIFTAGLSQGLNLALPGSGVFVSTLRSGLSGAYSHALSQVASFEGGDPDLFLAEQREALETVRTSYLAQADSIPDAQPEAFDALKWEYVLELEQNPTATETDPSARIRQIAAHYGIPPPDEATMERIALTVLEAHIRGVMEQDSDFQQGFGVSDFPSREAYTTAAARNYAYRHFYAGQPDRYCPVELELYGLGLLGAGTECRRWRSAQP